MSHFPCIRPSLLNKKWIIQETKLNRIEIVRRKEEALLQKFKLISKQGTFRGKQNMKNCCFYCAVKIVLRSLKFKEEDNLIFLN